MTGKFIGTGGSFYPTEEAKAQSASISGASHVSSIVPVLNESYSSEEAITIQPGSYHLLLHKFTEGKTVQGGVVLQNPGDIKYVFQHTLGDANLTFFELEDKELNNVTRNTFVEFMTKTNGYRLRIYNIGNEPVNIC